MIGRFFSEDEDRLPDSSLLGLQCRIRAAAGDAAGARAAGDAALEAAVCPFARAYLKRHP